MKKLLMAAAIVIAFGFVIFEALAYMGKDGAVLALIHPGFTDSQVREVEQTIKDEYVRRLLASPSPVERYQVASGSTTVEVTMMKVSAMKLEGFVKISLHDEESKKAGLDEITQSCEATMSVESRQWLWKCQK